MKHKRDKKWMDKIVATRRKNGSYVVSEKTREKMRLSAKLRKMPPMTEEHKQKLRKANKKTWSNPELIKKHGEKAKQIWSKVSPEEKQKHLIRLKIFAQTPENKERARKLMIRLQTDPILIKK